MISGCILSILSITFREYYVWRVLVLYLGTQTHCFGLACRLWPTFVGCGSNDGIIFRAFAVYFGFRGLVLLRLPQVPAGAARRLAWPMGVSWLGGRLPRLGCLFRWDLLFSAPSCLPGAPENVSGRRAISGPWGQRQLPGQVTVHALAESPHLYLLVAQVRLSRNRSLRPCPVATYYYGSPINSLFLGYELAW